MIDFIASNAGLVGLLFFFSVFSGIAVWAYLPKNKHALEAHGEIPLKESENDD